MCGEKYTWIRGSLNIPLKNKSLSTDPLLEKKIFSPKIHPIIQRCHHFSVQMVWDFRTGSFEMMLFEIIEVVRDTVLWVSST